MEAGTPIVVVARWQTAPASAGDVLAHLAELQALSLAEPGCIGYEVFQGLEGPGTLLLVERYRDGAALEAHRGSAHYRRLVVEQIIPLLVHRRVELLQAPVAA